MSEKNKIKIALSDKTFDITLNSGESLDLKLINHGGEIYLSSMPSENLMNNASINVKNGYKSVSYQFDEVNSSTNQIETPPFNNSSIYELLNRNESNVEVNNDFIGGTKNKEVLVNQSEIDAKGGSDIKTFDDKNDDINEREPFEENQSNEEPEPENQEDSNIESLKRKYFPIDDEE